MALAKGVPEVYSIARAVGDMFRYTVGYQHDLVKLSQELTHSKNYLLVQEHRFSGRCKVNVEVESEVLNTPIPQFILQPIVENAFDHGLQNKKDEWRVTVKGCVQRRAHIIVIEDNGVGMKPEELRSLRDKLRNDTDTVKSRRSIGLRNVNARLQLQFGQRFGLRVFSTYGRGTRVVVVLPKEYTG
jgi:two-component system sensor histidine kinase YesM